jgi:hypothetical protein
VTFDRAIATIFACGLVALDVPSWGGFDDAIDAAIERDTTLSVVVKTGGRPFVAQLGIWVP